MNMRAESTWSWAGLFGAALAWYGAHQLGLYFSDLNCTHRWIVPSLQLAGLLLTMLAALPPWRTLRAEDRPTGGPLQFASLLALGAAGIFGLALIFQAAASLVYDGCAR